MKEKELKQQLKEIKEGLETLKKFLQMFLAQQLGNEVEEEAISKHLNPNKINMKDKELNNHYRSYLG